MCLGVNPYPRHLTNCGQTMPVPRYRISYGLHREHGLAQREVAVRLLLERGAKASINHYQQTALDLAQIDDLTAITRLVEAKDQADAEQNRAQTLIKAVKAGG